MMTELTDQQIEDLTRRMTKVSPHYKSNLDAGLTYLGQLISHDIVPATTKDSASRHVTPALNLDSFYGDISLDNLKHNPGSSPYLDDHCHGYFYLDDCTNCDFKRVDKNGKHIAIIPEQRNDQHIMIAQLQVFWLNFHNYLLKNELVTDALQARKVVTLVFQLIVIEEFLRELLTRDVFEYCFRQNHQYDLTEMSESIPDFFSYASFRFGHSMPRTFYELKMIPKDAEHNFIPSHVFKPVPLMDLFSSGKKICIEKKIDWSMFFTSGHDDIFCQKSFAINTHITGIGIKEDINIAEHVVSGNLKVARAVKLPTGIEMATKILEKLPSCSHHHIQLITDQDFASTELGQVGIGIKELPLWPYILLEAELQSKNRTTGHGGRHLAGLGSILNASVLKRSMMAAQFSVFKQGQYDFDDVIERLGKFGEKYQDVDNSAKQLTMMTLITMMKSGENDAH